jgi:hypothetical protein
MRTQESNGRIFIAIDQKLKDLEMTGRGGVDAERCATLWIHFHLA